MLKKYTWIVAALVTLAMVFSFTITGCSDGRDDKIVDLDTKPLFKMSTDVTIQAMTDGTKLTNSSSPWLRRGGANGHITFDKSGSDVRIKIENDWADSSNTVEIRANSLSNFYKGGYAQGRTHTVTVTGTTNAATVSFAGAGKPVNGGAFTLVHGFTWSELLSMPTIRLNFGNDPHTSFISEIIVQAAHSCGCIADECKDKLDCDGEVGNECNASCVCACCVLLYDEPVLIMHCVNASQNWAGFDFLNSHFEFEVDDVIFVKAIGVTHLNTGASILFTANGSNNWNNRFQTGVSFTVDGGSPQTTNNGNPGIQAGQVVEITITLDADLVAAIGAGGNHIRMCFWNGTDGDAVAFEQITVTRGTTELLNLAEIIENESKGDLTGSELSTLLTGSGLQGAGNDANVRFSIDGP